MKKTSKTNEPELKNKSKKNSIPKDTRSESQSKCKSSLVTTKSENSPANKKIISNKVANSDTQETKMIKSNFLKIEEIPEVDEKTFQCSQHPLRNFEYDILGCLDQLEKLANSRESLFASILLKLENKPKKEKVKNLKESKNNVELTTLINEIKKSFEQSHLFSIQDSEIRGNIRTLTQNHIKQINIFMDNQDSKNQSSGQLNKNNEILQKSSQDLQEYQRLLKEKEIKIKELTENIEYHEKRLNYIQTHYSEKNSYLENEKNELSLKLEQSLSNSSKAENDLKQKMQKLENKIKELNLENQNIRLNLQYSEIDLENCKREKSAIEENLEEKVNHNKKILSQLKSKETEMAFQSMRNESDQKINEQILIINDLKNQISQKLHKIEKLETDLKTLQGQYEILRGFSDNLENENKSLKLKLDEKPKGTNLRPSSENFSRSNFKKAENFNENSRNSYRGTSPTLVTFTNKPLNKDIESYNIKLLNDLKSCTPNAEECPEAFTYPPVSDRQSLEFQINNEIERIKSFFSSFEKIRTGSSSSSHSRNSTRQSPSNNSKNLKTGKNEEDFKIKENQSYEKILTARNNSLHEELQLLKTSYDELQSKVFFDSGFIEDLESENKELMQEVADLKTYAFHLEREIKKS